MWHIVRDMSKTSRLDHSHHSHHSHHSLHSHHSHHSLHSHHSHSHSHHSPTTTCTRGNGARVPRAGSADGQTSLCYAANWPLSSYQVCESGRIQQPGFSYKFSQVLAKHWQCREESKRPVSHRNCFQRWRISSNVGRIHQPGWPGWPRPRAHKPPGCHPPTPPPPPPSPLQKSIPTLNPGANHSSGEHVRS